MPKTSKNFIWRPFPLLLIEKVIFSIQEGTIEYMHDNGQRNTYQSVQIPSTISNQNERTCQFDLWALTAFRHLTLHLTRCDRWTLAPCRIQKDLDPADLDPRGFGPPGPYPIADLDPPPFADLDPLPTKHSFFLIYSNCELLGDVL